MRIVVVGAGQVGRAVARDMSRSHDIVVIDHNPDRLERLRYQADVMTIEGEGGDMAVLESARTAEADMIIASTDDDRVNILVCGIARMLQPDLFTVARVADTGFLKSWRHTMKAFNVDLMVGSNFLTATSIVQVVFDKMARQVEFFALGRIKMTEFTVPEGCRLAGKTVQESDIYEGLRYAAVFDEEAMEVVRGSTVIKGGSRLVVIGRTDEVTRFGKDVAGPASKPSGRVFILGGGEIAFQTARLMQQRRVTPKVIEKDRARAEFLAKNLPRSFVLHGDATDPEFLESEGISRARVVVAALRPDDRNLFVSLQAKHLGAERVVSVVHDKRHQALFEKNGVEVTFNPRKEVIEEIIRHTRRRRLERVTFVEDHRAEVIEVRLRPDSPLVGRPLKESAQELPSAMVIGAVYRRGGEIIIPTGATVLEAEDDLVIFLDAEVVEEVMERL